MSAVWRARAKGLVTIRTGAKRSAIHPPAARAWQRPSSVSGTSGVRQKTRSRLPSLSPCRMRRSRPIQSPGPTLAVAVQAVDQLPQPAEARAIEFEYEPWEPHELGRIFPLLLERPGLHDLALHHDVGEVVSELGHQALGYPVREAVDQVPVDRPGREPGDPARTRLQIGRAHV